MALIEGVGDEVTVLFGLVLLFLVLMLAWASTHTADRSEQLFHSSVASVASQRRTSNRSASGESSLDSNFTASVHTSTDQPQSSSANNESLEDDSVLSRNMVLRLKFLNDTERVAQVKPGDTIGYIKRYTANLGLIYMYISYFIILDVKSSKLYTVWHKISACLKT
uniref:Uncharacterized protein n=1 Tax=Erpetoichthys calabaricus TaxID=27687 RepID=A0A8C4TLK9_ERPCA